jgi:DNA-binding response OmpR family regulator
MGNGIGRMHAQRLALLIEDDRDIAESASLRLQGAGFRAQIAGNAEDGLLLAERLHPDVIILDIRLPKMDGLTALRKLKANGATQGIPVVALSASVVDQHSALEEGARFYLKKPYDARELLSAVETAVNHPAHIVARGEATARPDSGDNHHEHHSQQSAGSFD